MSVIGVVLERTEATEAQIQCSIDNPVWRPFDLEHGPLIRAALARSKRG